MLTLSESKNKKSISLFSSVLALLLGLVFCCPLPSQGAEKATSSNNASSSPRKVATVKKPPQTSAKKRSATPKKTASKKSATQKNKQAKSSTLRGKTGKVTIRPPVQVYGSVEMVEQVSAQSVIIMDADNGRIIWAKNPDQPRQPASTIKVITGLIAINSLKRHDIVPVSDKAAKMPRSKIYLDPDQFYVADDLINAVLLASANDASVALAEKIAGSEEKFAALMNQSAKKWGARNTICHTASGLTAKGQQTTARDLAMIFRYAMGNKEFAQRIAQRSGTTRCGKDLKNHNKALWRIDGAVAGKTGYTNAARQTYVGQFTRDEQTIIVALMGSETMWVDLKKLVDHGFQTAASKNGQLASKQTP